MNINTRAVWAVAACVLLAGCAAPPKTVALRVDGRPIDTDPLLKSQYHIDRTICFGEAEKAGLSGVSFSGGGLDALAASNRRNSAELSVMDGCMAQHGYVKVREEEAQQRQEEFARMNAQVKK